MCCVAAAAGGGGGIDYTSHDHTHKESLAFLAFYDIDVTTRTVHIA